MQIKRAFIDVETTGLDPSENGIHQVSGIIEIDGEEKERFDFKVRPFAEDEILKGALDVSGVTESEIKEYEKPESVHIKLLNILGKHVDKFDKSDKLYFMAYNSPFDNKFMRGWFRKLGDKYFGSWFFHDICVMRKSVDVHSNTGTRLNSHSLQSVAEHYELAKRDDPRWHDAAFDVEMTRAIYNLLNKGEKTCQG